MATSEASKSSRGRPAGDYQVSPAPSDDLPQLDPTLALENLYRVQQEGVPVKRARAGRSSAGPNAPARGLIARRKPYRGDCRRRAWLSKGPPTRQVAFRLR